jgi:hypothetical protein
MSRPYRVYRPRVDYIGKNRELWNEWATMFMIEESPGDAVGFG